MKLEGNGYYCKNCHKRLKLRQGVPAPTNPEVHCARCGKAINADDTRVKDGNNVYCSRCYILVQTPTLRDEVVQALMPGWEFGCAACGKVLTRYDDQVQDKGKSYCKNCYEKIRREQLHDSAVVGKEFLPNPKGNTSIKDADKLIECMHCGMYITLDRLTEDKDGKIRCKKCGKVLPVRFRGTWQGKGEAQSVKKNDRDAQKEDYSAAAQLFKCLGDPCRIKIIELLSQRELYVFEFVDMTGFQYSAVSYHLKMLKEMGMVKSYEKGNFVVYSLTDKGEVVHEFITRSRELS